VGVGQQIAGIAGHGSGKEVGTLNSAPIEPESLKSTPIWDELEQQR
jgi:hypothetical protein